jgi:MFS family permease
MCSAGNRYCYHDSTLGSFIDCIIQLVLASALFFAVGSIVAAVANNFTMMIIGRSIQGIGGGGILTLGEILVTDLVPLSVRGGMFSSPHQIS